jgi:hypothetical protein
MLLPIYLCAYHAAVCLCVYIPESKRRALKYCVPFYFLFWAYEGRVFNTVQSSAAQSNPVQSSPVQSSPIQSGIKVEVGQEHLACLPAYCYMERRDY